MGIGFRIFLFDDNDALIPLSIARYQRLRKREAGERLPQFAGKRVRCAMVVLEVAGRKPLAINRIDYFILSFDANGQIDATQLEKELRLAVETTPPISEKEASEQVIDARSHFAKKRYEHEFIWKPTPDIQAAIVAAIFDKEPA